MAFRHFVFSGGAMMRLMLIVSLFLFSCNFGSNEIVPIEQTLVSEVLTFKYKGSYAFAGFFAEDGCQYTSIYVGAGDQVLKNGPGQPIETVQAYLYVDLFDVCDQNGKFGSAVLEIQPGQFLAPGNQLETASLDTGGEICFFGSQGEELGCEQISVALDWTGVGDVFKGMNRSMYSGPGYRMLFKDHGSYRDASVVGVVNIPTISVNLQFSSFGSLSFSKGGSMSLTK